MNGKKLNSDSLHTHFITTEGIVVHSVKFGEGHKIITLYTKLLGKIDISAFGVRKTKSKWGSKVQQFTVGNFLLYKKGEEKLFTLKDVEVVNYNISLRETIQRYIVGSCMLESIIRFVENNQPDIKLYELLLGAIKLLGNISIEKIYFLLSMYELHFLSIEGYTLSFEKCVVCGGYLNDESKFYASEYEGFPLCKGCAKIGSFMVLDSTVRFLRWAQNAALGNARRVVMEKATYENIRKVIETLFAHFFHTKLKSWDQVGIGLYQ